MEKKDIKILIVSLAVLSQYDTKISLQISGEEPEVKDLTLQDVVDFEDSLKQGVDVQIKPYLRPMSSMTEDEKKEFIDLCSTHYTISSGMDQTYLTIDVGKGFHRQDAKPYNKIEDIKIIDWFNEHHFDYRGLIEKGLALEAPEGMY